MTEPIPEYQKRVSRVLQTKNETKLFYEKIAGVYDLLAEFSEQPMREAGLTMLAAASGEAILEIGCGTGYCLVEIARAVGSQGRVVGVDISENMLEEVRKRLSHEQVELYCCDAARLPLTDGILDGIFTSFTLELFDALELPQVLGEWWRVLKPGGRLVVVAISKECPPGLAPIPFERTHRHFPNLMDCCPIHVRRAVEAAGFSIDSASVESMWVPVEIVCGVKPR